MSHQRCASDPSGRSLDGVARVVAAGGTGADVIGIGRQEVVGQFALLFSRQTGDGLVSKSGSSAVRLCGSIGIHTPSSPRMQGKRQGQHSLSSLWAAWAPMVAAAAGGSLFAHSCSPLGSSDFFFRYHAPKRMRHERGENPEADLPHWEPRMMLAMAMGGKLGVWKTLEQKQESRKQKTGRRERVRIASCEKSHSRSNQSAASDWSAARPFGGGGALPSAWGDDNTDKSGHQSRGVAGTGLQFLRLCLSDTVFPTQFSLCRGGRIAAAIYAYLYDRSCPFFRHHRVTLTGDDPTTAVGLGEILCTMYDNIPPCRRFYSWTLDGATVSVS